jgi:hypothetical protein
MGISTSWNPDTPEGLEQRLSQNPLDSGRASALEQTRVEKSCRTRRIPVELPCLRYEEGSQQGGMPFGPQSLTILPTRLCLASTLRMGALQVESPKCGVCVCVSTFTGMGVFIEPWGSSIDLADAVTHQVVADRPSHITSRPSHVASRPISSASTNFLQHHSLPFLM